MVINFSPDKRPSTLALAFISRESDLVEKIGGSVLMKDVLKDDKEHLESFLSEAMESCDLVISSGGVSMGRFDYVRDVFLDLGVEEHFWKVAQKPGKPLFLGQGLKH